MEYVAGCSFVTLQDTNKKLFEIVHLMYCGINSSFFASFLLVILEY